MKAGKYFIRSWSVEILATNIITVVIYISVKIAGLHFADNGIMRNEAVRVRDYRRHDIKI